MKKSTGISMAILLFLLIFALPAGSARADIPNPCGLFSQEDAEALLGLEATTVRGTDAVSPAGKVCTYFFKKDGGVYEVKVRIASDEEISEEGIYDSAADVFVRQAEARKKHDYASTKYREMEVAAAEAFWSGSSLWALKGDLLFIISVKAPLAGSFSSMDEANAAREENNMNLSLKALETVLERLP